MLTRQAPLAGVRVITVEQFGAGPLGTLYLADLGAFGDVGRPVPSGQRAARTPRTQRVVS